MNEILRFFSWTLFVYYGAANIFYLVLLTASVIATIIQSKRIGTLLLD